MNTDAEQIYLKSIQALDQMMSANADEMAGWSEFDYTQINDIPSNLDAYDYCFSIAIGMAGSFISTSKELARYLEEIHKVASESGNNPDFLQKVLGKLLHHKLMRRLLLAVAIMHTACSIASYGGTIF